MKHLASAGAQGCWVGWGERWSLTPGTLTVKQWGEHWMFGTQCLLPGNWGVSLLGPQRYLCPSVGLASMTLLLNLQTFLCIWGQDRSLRCSLQAVNPPSLTSLGDLALCLFCQDTLRQFEAGAGQGSDRAGRGPAQPGRHSQTEERRQPGA